MEQRTKYGNIDTKYFSTALKPANSCNRTVNPLHSNTKNYNKY